MNEVKIILFKSKKENINMMIIKFSYKIKKFFFFFCLFMHLGSRCWRRWIWEDDRGAKRIIWITKINKAFEKFSGTNFKAERRRKIKKNAKRRKIAA